MKVEVELPPGVYPTDAEVQELLRKFQDIKAATFKFRLRRLLLKQIRTGRSHEETTDLQVGAAMNAFEDLVQTTECKIPPISVATYSEGVEDFRRAILERLV